MSCLSDQIRFCLECRAFYMRCEWDESSLGIIFISSRRPTVSLHYSRFDERICESNYIFAFPWISYYSTPSKQTQLAELYKSENETVKGNELFKASLLSKNWEKNLISIHPVCYYRKPRNKLICRSRPFSETSFYSKE